MLQYEKVTHKNFEIGMQVKLMYPDPEYNDGPENPAIGTAFECVGTITGFEDYSEDYDEDEDEEPYVEFSVLWSNSNENTYKNNELVTLNPTHLGKRLLCKNIWESL